MLRPADDDDLPVLLRWRNHPRVRAASFTTHEIGEAEHARWWARVRDDPARRVLVYEHDATPAGVVTFSGLEPGRTIGEWGFYLDLAGLERSGALLAAWIGLERAAIGHAFGPLGLATLRGAVLAANEPVRWLHRRFGFVETGTHRREAGGVPVDVVTIELTKGENA